MAWTLGDLHEGVCCMAETAAELGWTAKGPASTSFCYDGGAPAVATSSRALETRGATCEHASPAGQWEHQMKSIQTSSMITQKTVEPSASISLKPPPIDHHKSSFDDDDSTNKPLVRKANMAPINATVYSVADLRMATGSFNIENLIGEGSLGRVYRAQFNDGKVLAVKKINSSALPNQSTDDFLEVVSNIFRLHHPNVTELVGYCSEHGQYLVVYEFLRNGSLHDFLHLSDEYSKPLTWNTRVKIALGTARALE
ncbi:hypothetical protein Taro_021795 [Colocasia esculenta]|uniref:Protein kinase domain-containing protein n=1 Tax=Colocasia esculenta TaxID=4460 RepID=A0A843USG8_COLES|nr:hypothetical protein [Colocasia esculenta]